MEGSWDEEMEEKGEMKGDRERCGGRPGGDQWGGWDAIWQVQLGDCPPPSAANWSIWRPITAADVTRASSNPIITHAHARTHAHTPSVQTSFDPRSDPVVSPCAFLLNLLNVGQPLPAARLAGAHIASGPPRGWERSNGSRRLSAHVLKPSD